MMLGEAGWNFVIHMTRFFGLVVLALIAAGAAFAVIRLAIERVGDRLFGKQARAKHAAATASAAEAVSEASAMTYRADIAKAVGDRANAVYWEQLIAAVGRSMAGAGYVFGSKQDVEVTLPYSVLMSAADAFSRARTEFLCPYMSPDDIEKCVRWNREDGFSVKYVATIIDAMRDAGRYVQQLSEAEVLARITVPTADYMSNGLSEKVVAANCTTQIQIRSE
ncbi:hypothetical protein G3O06_23630 [Burkholderia sp. Ac-20345]|uniref:hypothetical protein n=1 Tax=Burkholderia sp. Ac-20345 TaxID=2703891 RepID=UPI00197C5F1B|nr:hypothetical protein [Burkholderia sp. Ac-20345]MBN3780509.1 hypothetical protein [Burkholderia sp. Ac-20345]